MGSQGCHLLTSTFVSSYFSGPLLVGLPGEEWHPFSGVVTSALGRGVHTRLSALPLLLFNRVDMRSR